MKKSFSLLLIVALIFTLSQSVFAFESGGVRASSYGLTGEELNIVKNKIGLTDEKLQFYSSETLRYLIANDAVMLTNNKPKKYSLNAESAARSDMSTLDLTDKDIQLYAEAYETNSDIWGDRKIFLFGS